MADYGQFLEAPTFKFIVGEEGRVFNVHESIIKDVSKPLARMMDGQMQEAKQGFATLKDVDSSVFAAFCEFAYTGNYEAPELPASNDDEAVDNENPSAKAEQDSDTDCDTDCNDICCRPRKKHPHRGCWKGTCVLCNTAAPPIVPVSLAQHRWNRFKTATNILGTAFMGPFPYDPKPDKANEPLLFHSKMFVFADTYIVVGLKQICLKRVHFELLDDNTVETDCTKAIEYVFDNTTRSDPEKGFNPLRMLLIEYATCKASSLAKDADFLNLVENNGEIGLELFHFMVFGRI